VITVVDASIAVRWFAPHGDADDAIADRVLARVIARPAAHVVPELFVYEVMAVLIRELADAPAVQRAMRRLDRLAMRRVRQDPQLVEAASRLAQRHRLTGYDAAYVALAETLGGRWLTLDARACVRLRGTTLGELAR
jgi:predicted nucleic acid-binding protein